MVGEGVYFVEGNEKLLVGYVEFDDVALQFVDFFHYHPEVQTLYFFIFAIGNIKLFHVFLQFPLTQLHVFDHLPYVFGHCTLEDLLHSVLGLSFGLERIHYVLLRNLTRYPLVYPRMLLQLRHLRPLTPVLFQATLYEIYTLS